MKSLLGLQTALGAGGVGTAEHWCVKPLTASRPWHLLPLKEQQPINVYGFFFPQYVFVFWNTGGGKKNVLLGFCPFHIKAGGIVSLGTCAGGDGPWAADGMLTRESSPKELYPCDFLF